MSFYEHFAVALILFPEHPTMREMKRGLLLLVVSCISVFSVQAEVIRLTGNITSRDLNRALEYLVDEEGALHPAEAYAERDEFEPFPRRSVQIPRDGVVWLLLEVENRGESSRWILENSMNVELMELFLREEGEWRLKQRTGNMVPFAQRELETRNPVFELRLEKNQRRDILIRLTDFQSASVRLKIEGAESFAVEYNRRTLLLGLVFGFFAALIVYNLIVYSMNRERVYLIYSLYMTAFFFNQLAQERLFSQFIEPNQPYGFRWFILFGGLTAALGIEFIRRFIETKRRMPRIDLGMRINRNLCILLALSGIFYAGPVSADILNILSLSAMALIITALILRLQRGDMLALVCLSGSLVYLAGTAAEIIATLAPVQVTPFVLNAQLYGALAQVLFLGFALGGKSYRLRKEYNRMQRRFQDELESKVLDRTRELEKANRKLEEAAVTDALTGLYNRTELGRRASGKAHPIRRRRFAELQGEGKEPDLDKVIPGFFTLCPSSNRLQRPDGRPWC